MIKGFIEVHNRHNDGSLVMINVFHITDVWGDEIYIGADDTHIRCTESYEDIRQKIKEAVGETT